MEEDLRGYLDWITQAEDLDAEPTSGGLAGIGATNSNSKDNGTGNGRKTSEVILGLLKSSMVPMLLHGEHENGRPTGGIIDVESCSSKKPTTSISGNADSMPTYYYYHLAQNNIYG